MVEARVPFEPGRLGQRVPRPQPGIQRAVGVVAPVELIEAHPGVQLPAAELQLGFGELAQVAERLRVRNLLLLRDRRTELPDLQRRLDVRVHHVPVPGKVDSGAERKPGPRLPARVGAQRERPVEDAACLVEPEGPAPGPGGVEGLDREPEQWSDANRDGIRHRMAPAEAELVRTGVRVHLERLVARPALLDERERVVGAEGEQRQLVAVEELVIEARLVVPVHRRDAGDAVLGVVGEEQGQEQIDVAAASGDRDLRALAERRFDEPDRLQQVDRNAAVDPLWISLPCADVNRTGQVAPVVRAISAWVEVDAIEELLVDDRGAAEEMVEDGDSLPVEVDAGVRRRCPAHQQRAAQIRGAIHARKVLHDANGVVERPRHVDQLLVTERAAGRRVLGARPFHQRRVVADLGATQVQGDVRRAARIEPHALARLAEARSARPDLDLAGGDSQLEPSLCIGGHLRARREHVGAGERPARARFDHRPAQRRLVGAAVGRRRRLLAHDEVVDIPDPYRCRFAVDLRQPN